jgi:hypothetical protein
MRSAKMGEKDEVRTFANFHYAVAGLQVRS